MHRPRPVLLVVFLALVPRLAAPQVRAGDPFPINRQTAGQQSGQSLAQAPDGSLVVVWQSEGGPGDPAVKMRRFDVLGHPLADEMQANLTKPAFLSPARLEIAALGSGPAVAVDAAGNALVVWTGPEGSIDILARLFRPDGTPASGEIVVNAETPGSQALPAVAALANGFAVAWEAAGFCEVRARLLDRNGQPASAEFNVAGPQGCYNLGTAVVPGAGGGFVVGWSGQTLEHGDFGAFVRRFAADGTPLGNAFAVHPDLTGAHGLGTLATDPAGNLLAVWAKGDLFSPEPLPDLFAQRFDPQGQRVGGVIEVSDRNAGYQLAAAARLAADGSFVLAWRTEAFTSSPNIDRGLFVRAFASSGAALGPQQPVDLPGGASEGGTGLALAADGSFVVIGQGRDGAASGGLFGQRFTLRCESGSSALCLHGGRFQVEAAWSTAQGTSGAGVGQPLSPDTGTFWFFNPANVEMVVKILDGCPVNDRFWVFAGGLTDVRVELTVTDTTTHQSKTYVNPQGTAFQPIQDTGTFVSCP